jgi:hypothetical protein
LFTVVAIPSLLALLDACARSWHIPAARYISLPPIAGRGVLALFHPAPSPRHGALDRRPSCFGAFIGAMLWHVLGDTPFGVAIKMLAVLLAQLVLRADMPPALALALLPLVLHPDPQGYVGGVAIGTAGLGVAFAVSQIARSSLSRSTLGRRNG